MKYFSVILILFFSMGFVNKGDIPNVPVGAGTDEGFDLQGHRGCRGLMPENTIPAMLKAIDLGVNTLEMDAVVSKDNKVVVSHEPWFESEISTKPDGSFINPAEVLRYNIYQMDYDSIKKYDVGVKPNPRFPQQQKMKAIKPLLSDLIDSVETYLAKRKLPKVKYNIEIKSLPAGDNKFHPVPADFAELLVAVIKEKKIEGRVIIQSFDFRALKYVHEKYPSIKTSMLIEDSDENDFDGQLAKLGYTPEYYSPNQTLVDDKLVRQCHNKGMKMLPWTVNDAKQLKKLRKMGVDGIITDYPDVIR